MEEENRFSEEELIGKGGFGSVYKVFDNDWKKYCAKKVLEFQSVDKEKIIKAKEEIRIQLRGDHKNIIRVFEHYDVPGPNYTEIVILMEYGDGGDLYNLIRRKARSGGKFTEKQILRIMSEICEGLAYCHSKKIAHKDLKPKNIVIMNNIAKICDFGIARIIQKTDEYIETKRKTLAYAAPEVFKGQFRPLPADIWSLGCICYELCALNRPFLSDPNKSPDYDQTVLSNYSNELRSLIVSMLQVNPIDRPTAKILLAKMKALAQDEPTYSQSIGRRGLLQSIDIKPKGQNVLAIEEAKYMNPPKALIQTDGIENRKPLEIRESPEITEKALPKSVLLGAPIINKEARLISYDTGEYVPENSKCRFCDYKGDAKELEEHEEICPENIVECENYGCWLSIQISSLEQHKKECQFGNEICNTERNMIEISKENHYCDHKNCKYEGDTQELADHIKKKHPKNRRMKIILATIISIFIVCVTIGVLLFVFLRKGSEEDGNATSVPVSVPVPVPVPVPPLTEDTLFVLARDHIYKLNDKFESTRLNLDVYGFDSIKGDLNSYGLYILCRNSKLMLYDLKTSYFSYELPYPGTSDVTCLFISDYEALCPMENTILKYTINIDDLAKSSYSEFATVKESILSIIKPFFRILYVVGKNYLSIIDENANLLREITLASYHLLIVLTSGDIIYKYSQNAIDALNAKYILDPNAELQNVGLELSNIKIEAIISLQLGSNYFAIIGQSNIQEATDHGGVIQIAQLQSDYYIKIIKEKRNIGVVWEFKLNFIAEIEEGIIYIAERNNDAKLICKWTYMIDNEPTCSYVEFNDGGELYDIIKVHINQAEAMKEETELEVEFMIPPNFVSYAITNKDIYRINDKFELTGMNVDDSNLPNRKGDLTSHGLYITSTFTDDQQLIMYNLTNNAFSYIFQSTIPYNCPNIYTSCSVRSNYEGFCYTYSNNINMIIKYTIDSSNLEKHTYSKFASVPRNIDLIINLSDKILLVISSFQLYVFDENANLVKEFEYNMGGYDLALFKSGIVIIEDAGYAKTKVMDLRFILSDYITLRNVTYEHKYSYSVIITLQLGEDGYFARGGVRAIIDGGIVQIGELFSNFTIEIIKEKKI